MSPRSLALERGLKSVQELFPEIDIQGMTRSLPGLKSIIEVGGDLETDEFRNGYVAFDFVCAGKMQRRAVLYSFSLLTSWENIYRVRVGLVWVDTEGDMGGSVIVPEAGVLWPW